MGEGDTGKARGWERMEEGKGICGKFIYKIIERQKSHKKDNWREGVLEIPTKSCLNVSKIQEFKSVVSKCSK